MFVAVGHGHIILSHINGFDHIIINWSYFNICKETTMIDNFNLIKPFLKFDKKGDFYFGQIMQRRKDNPDQKKSDNRILKDFFITSNEKLENKRDEIIGFCRYFNARAYINLNLRNQRDVAFQMLQETGDRMSREEYHKLGSIYATCCGKKRSEQNKKWVVDFDNGEDSGFLGRVKSEIEFNCEPYGEKILIEIPTPNGVHLITKPFNLTQFKYSGMVEVHKDNPTILFKP